MLKEIKAGKFRKLMDSILRKSIGYPREFLSGLCNIGFNFDDEKQDNGIIFCRLYWFWGNPKKTMLFFFQQRISFFFRFFPFL